MLDEATRTAILRLKAEGHSDRTIAKAVGISRASVKAVIQANSATVPPMARASQVDSLRDRVLELYARYEGRLTRVYEVLKGEHDVPFSYSALTAFCRKHEIGKAPRLPAGRYTFEHGAEMQHDTSPHFSQIAGVRTSVQTASLVMCASHMTFFQHYPRFTRFECKVFLTEALNYFGASAKVCMIDNSHVVVAAGTGKDMIPSPEMAAFAKRYGFEFKAHEKGDANRSARVEIPFDRIDKGFLTGEEFASWKDLNERARATCDKWNAQFSRNLHASRRELFAAERPHLVPLPLHVPEVYLIHTRIVDAEGYVNLNRIRYSAPYRFIGRTLEVRETIERIDLYDGPRRVASHGRCAGPPDARVTDPTHRPPRGTLTRQKETPPEVTEMLKLEPKVESYVKALREHVGDRRAPLRRLYTMLQEYPRQAFLIALAEAERYRLFDLERLEKMVLRQIAHEYFVLKDPKNE